MGQSKVKAVGGQPTSPLAKSFTDFLQQGLQTGYFGQSVGQTQGLAGALNNLIAGRPGDPTSLKAYQDQQYNLQNFNVPQAYSAPIGASGFQAGIGTTANLGPVPGNSILNQQFNAGIGTSPLTFLTQQFQTPQSNINFGVNAPSVDVNGFGPVPYAGPTNFSPTPNMLMDPNVNGPLATAIQNVLKNQQNQNVAELRARFAAGGQGGVSQSGTPAAYAEAIYRANSDPLIAQALGNLNLQQSAQQIQNAGMNQQERANLLGLAANTALQNKSQDTWALSNLLNAQLQQRGQDINSQLQSQGLSLDQQKQNIIAALQTQGMGLQQAQAAADTLLNVGNQNLQAQGLGLQQGQSLLNSLLQQRSQDLSNQVSNRGLDINQLNIIRDILGTNQNNNLAAQQLNINSILNQLGQAQNYNLGLGSQALTSQAQQLQGQLNALSQLFGGYNQANAMGTPQAQLVQQPSLLSQITGAIGNISNAIGQGRSAFGGFGGIGSGPIPLPSVSTPAFSLPNPAINLPATVPYPSIFPIP